MTPEKYKELSIKEFTQAAKICHLKRVPLMLLSVRTVSTTTLIRRLSSTVHTVFCVKVDVWF